MRFLLACVALLAAARVDAAPLLRDDYGKALRLDAPAARVVSLAPHLTELLFAAGAGDRLVGADAYSDHPAAARSVPRVGSPAGIDIEAVLALEPDLVLAWPGAGNARSIERLAALGVAVYRSEPRTLEDVATTLERLGALTGRSAQAMRAAHEFRARAQRLAERYAAQRKVRVFYQVWDQPLITVNGEHLISRVIALCGGENVFAGLGPLAPQIDREAVLRADPDAIVASGAPEAPSGGPLAWRAYPGLRAVRSGQLHAVPADLLQRHTPRILDGAEHLCRALEAARAAR